MGGGGSGSRQGPVPLGRLRWGARQRPGAQHHQASHQFAPQNCAEDKYNRVFPAVGLPVGAQRTWAGRFFCFLLRVSERVALRSRHKRESPL